MKLISLKITGILILLSSCTTPQEQLIKIPEIEFDDFSYSRTGNVTATTIDATGAKRNDKEIVIDSVKVTTSNPFFGANIQIKGYKRKLK